MVLTSSISWAMLPHPQLPRIVIATIQQTV